MSATMNRRLLLALGLCATLLTPSAHAWWNEAWSQRARVVIDTTDRGQPLPTAVTEAVLPVRLHSGNFDFATAAADGADLRVIGADDKTPLPFSIERFDAVNELALLWVRVPVVAQGSDKNVLHVYAGNAQAAAEPPAAVFGDAYAAVLHFSETDGPARDAAHQAASTAPASREPNGLLGVPERHRRLRSLQPLV